MRLILLLLMTFGLSSCNWAPSWGVYKIEVNQGNYVTKDMVEKLKTGQSKGQVRLVLGTPLVTSVFHADRWDYVYQLHKQGSLIEHRKFAVFFANDKLTRWEGDEQPPSPVYRPSGEDGLKTSAPVQEEKGFWSRFWEKLGW